METLLHRKVDGHFKHQTQAEFMMTTLGSKQDLLELPSAKTYIVTCFFKNLI